MFAYCGNNAPNYIDGTGTAPRTVRDFSYNYIEPLPGGGGTGAGGGGVSLGIGWLIEAGKEAVLSFGVIATAISAALESTNDRGNYYVYVLVDQHQSVQYVGRTRNPIARESAHKRNPFRQDLDFKIVGSNLNYDQARGLEQVLMLYYHTLNTQNPKNNQINGISPNNDFIDEYIDAARGALGYVWNQLSNEVLTWLGQ